jgi:hypothetical protein
VRKLLKAGFSTLLLLLIILIVLLGGLAAFDFGYIKYKEQKNVMVTPTMAPGQNIKPVSAKGTFKKGNYSVDVVLNFNLDGGAVTGNFSGVCSGTISGNFDGKEAGAISGRAEGSCNPFVVPVPAGADFSGTVDKQQKTVMVNGTGSAAGISGSGALDLSF